MKRSSYLVLIALASAGLVFVGCDEPEEEPDVEEGETIDDEEMEVVDEEEDEEEDEEAAEVDEDMFILAAFESECVDAEIEEEEEAASIKEEIFARYGFTEDSFAEAKDAMAEHDDVKDAVATRMEDCDEEMAKGFAEEGAGGVEEEDEEAEEEAEEVEEAEEAAADSAPTQQARPEPARTGQMSGSVGGRGVDFGNIELQVRNDFSLRGRLRGESEGRSFQIPFNGEVSEDGDISASGERGGNTVEVSGTLSETGASGRVSGEIHQRDYRHPYNAN